MAKNKPSLAFLEALQHEKKKRGEPAKPGGSFKTPEWFFNQSKDSGPANSIGLGIGTMNSRRFRLKPAYVAAAAVVLALIAGAAYWAGKSHAPKTSEPTEVIKGRPAQPGVMDPLTGPQGAGDSPAPSPVIPAASAGTSAGPEQPAGGTRTIGMNYVIVQSYKDEKTASEACEALRKAGIDCTIERKLPYAPTWFVVVGTTPFVKANTPDYRDYVKRIEVVSERFAGTSKWKRFEPNAYKWK